MVVGAPLFDAGGTDEGAAFVFHGSAMGIAGGNQTTAAAMLQADVDNAHLGSSVAGAGDVNGDGDDTVGLYDPVNGNFFLRNAHTPGAADLVYGFGPAGLGWIPVVGDWNGDNVDTIGLYDPVNANFFLRNVHAPGAADLVYGFGPAAVG